MRSYFQDKKDQFHKAVFREQISLLFKQTPLVSLSNIPVVLITVYICFDTVPSALLFIWAAILSIYSVVRIYPTRLFHRYNEHSLHRWGWISILSVFIMGLLWGSLALFFDYGLSQFQQYYIVLLLLGISSIAIAANHAYLPTFFAFILPALLPLSLVFLFNESFENAGLSALIFFYIIILMSAAISTVNNTKKTIQLRMKNHQLVEELSLSNKELFSEIEERKHIQVELEKFTLLYIEDNKNNLELIKQFLQRISSADLLHAPSAELGIEIAQANQPDIILMDINLPGMNGYDALRQLRIDPETSSIPVIAISANAMPSDLIKGREAGFYEYVSKPVNFEHLGLALQSALKRH